MKHLMAKTLVVDQVVEPVKTLVSSLFKLVSSSFVFLLKYFKFLTMLSLTLGGM